jgi:hypothetical protein
MLKRLFLREMKDGLLIKEMYNAVYSKREIVDPILFSISRGYFLEYSVEEYGYECPDADTIFYRLKHAGIVHVITLYSLALQGIIGWTLKHQK